MSEKKPILIVQGAQWGSEAKGMVAAALCERRKVDYAVRTGAVNAGHAVYHQGKKYVNQQLPTGWVNKGTDLVIGPGALINPQIFFDELLMIHEAGFVGRVLVDHHAGLHLPDHSFMASESDKHYRIGATGKGCSFALVDRIQRNRNSMLFRDWAIMEPQGWEWADTVKILNDGYDYDKQILLEGTQGTLLDLYLGPYPYTTHKQCTAAQWVVEAGLSPALEYEVVLVARTYPIRVAGNSGPMPQEIDWPTLALEINHKLQEAGKPDLVRKTAIATFLDAKNRFPPSGYPDVNVWKSEGDRDALRGLPDHTVEELKKLFEFTTVTKKLRRVARLDIDSLKYSVMVNRPEWVCLTFVNYEFPEMWGMTKGTEERSMVFAKYMVDLEMALGVPIHAYTTGPESSNFIPIDSIWDPE